MTIDLHMHSSASDGTLAPAALMDLCAERGVTVAALTDHDTFAGVPEARDRALLLGMQFVPGAEMSCLWGGRCIHVVALGVRKEFLKPLQDIADETASLRVRRGHEIARRLQEHGFPDLLESARTFAQGRSELSRPHFARAMLARGLVASLQEAFDRYLGDGKPCFVDTPWRSLAEIVRAIRESRALPVLAHPGRYDFPAQWSHDGLVQAFVEAGGQGIEAVSGSQKPEWTARCLAWAKRWGLLLSAGSDFHSPQGHRPMPGAQGEIPEGWPTVLEAVTPMTA